jgi:hypothetical protein
VYLGHVISEYVLNIDAPNIEVLVVEPDYLPDSEVFYFQPCLYPMKYEVHSST